MSFGLKFLVEFDNLGLSVFSNENTDIRFSMEGTSGFLILYLSIHHNQIIRKAVAKICVN